MIHAAVKPTPDELFSHSAGNSMRRYMHFGKKEQRLWRRLVLAKLRRTLDDQDEFSFAG
jgi:hypothetical protein